MGRISSGRQLETFPSNLRLIGLLTLLSVIVGLSLYTYNYKREAERSTQYAELMKDRYQGALAKLESQSEECSKTIKSLRKGPPRGSLRTSTCWITMQGSWKGF